VRRAKEREKRRAAGEDVDEEEEDAKSGLRPVLLKPDGFIAPKRCNFG
jgi:hypothetical protein